MPSAGAVIPVGRPGSVLIVTGLEREGKLVAGPAARIVLSGGSRVALERRLEAVGTGPWAAVISFGLAGALAPHLAPGDIVLGASVLSGQRRWLAAETLFADWAARLQQAGLRSNLAEIAGVDAPVMSPADKAGLLARTGAAAVDMESHVAADFAERHGLEFGAIRVVSDGADRTLPPVAAHAMRPDGGIDLAAVILGLLRRPEQLPALLATARDAQIAFRQLGAVTRALGPALQAAD